MTSSRNVDPRLRNSNSLALNITKKHPNNICFTIRLSFVYLLQVPVCKLTRACYCSISNIAIITNTVVAKFPSFNTRSMSSTQGEYHIVFSQETHNLLTERIKHPRSRLKITFIDSRMHIMS